MQVKTKNLIVAALVVLLVGMAWYQLVYGSMESKASKAKSAAHDAEVAADSLRKSLSNFATPDGKKKSDVGSADLRAALPADVAEASFLRTLDTLRVTSGADWQSVTPSAPVISPDATIVSVGISAQGTEDQIARYLNGLYGLKRIFIVDNVSMTAQTGPGSPGGASGGGAVFGDKLQMTVTGRLFSQPTASVTPTGANGTSGAARTPVAGAPAPAG